MKIISFLMHYFSNSDADQVTRDQTISAKRPIRRESLLAVVLAVSLSDFVSSMMFTDNCPSHMRIFLPLVCSDGNILFDGLVSTSISSFLKPKLDRPAHCCVYCSSLSIGCCPLTSNVSQVDRTWAFLRIYIQWHLRPSLIIISSINFHMHGMRSFKLRERRRFTQVSLLDFDLGINHEQVFQAILMDIQHRDRSAVACGHIKKLKTYRFCQRIRYPLTTMKSK